MSSTEAAETQNSLRARGRSPYFLWMIWATWLPFLIPDIVTWLQGHPSLPRMIATLIVLAVFIAFYLWTTLQNARRLVARSSSVERAEIPVWLTTAIYLILGFTLLILASEHGFAWFSPFIYTVAYIGGRFSLKRALPMIAALVVCISLAGWLLGFSLTSIGSAIFYVVIVGLVVVFLMRVIAANQELRGAREEIARLAVTAERLRIARDLHDLLGHNLSLIALKSELARRLIAVSPERAATEIGDIETVARTTLQEVREAVASYRQPTLASELQGAQEILAAAGIAYRYEGDAEIIATLPASIEAALSWVVREGVTNVIRHSRARHCTIRLNRSSNTVRVEVIDDGSGVPLTVTSTGSLTGSGNGLRGLSERVSALGGSCEVGPRKEGGFRLAVALPLARDERRTVQSLPAQHTGDNGEENRQ